MRVASAGLSIFLGAVLRSELVGTSRQALRDERVPAASGYLGSGGQTRGGGVGVQRIARIITFRGKGTDEVRVYNGNIIFILHRFRVASSARGRLEALLKLSIYRRSHYTCACVREPLEQTCERRRRRSWGAEGGCTAATVATITTAAATAAAAGIDINIQQH